MPLEPTADFVELSGRRLHIRQLGHDMEGSPLIFLHEGLGSVDLWREFPAEVVSRSCHPGVVYSRYGNGWSTPLTEPHTPDYMHTEALEILPELISRLDVGPPILIGHSDGASIAIIYAGSGRPVRGLVLIAPHVFVEPSTIQSIATINEAFLDSDMAEKMARYHAEPATTFRGWADVWTHPDFSSWNIEAFLQGVLCPTLLIQGDEDEYGTLSQLDAIDGGLSVPARRTIVAGARHSPHLSHPEVVTEAVVDFVVTLG